MKRNVHLRIKKLTQRLNIVLEASGHEEQSTNTPTPDIHNRVHIDVPIVLFLQLQP